MKHTITQHLKNKSFFLIGIGGSGMMGIAELLHNLGFTVRGSDIQDNNAIKRLRKMKTLLLQLKSWIRAHYQSRNRQSRSRTMQPISSQAVQ